MTLVELATESQVPTDIVTRFRDIAAEVEVATNFDTVALMTDEACSQLIINYVNFHNMENGEEASRASHNSQTDAIYSRQFLPTLIAMRNWAKENEKPEMLKKSSDALLLLAQTMTYFEGQIHTEVGETQAEAFSRLVVGDANAEMTYQTFLYQMKMAKFSAAECIHLHGDEVPVKLPTTCRKNEVKPFSEVAKAAIDEFIQSELGVGLGPDFMERLNDPNTEAFGFSIDVNSTLNMDESYANAELLRKVCAQFRWLKEIFKRKYPDKQLFLILNTGRPALFIQGVLETLPALAVLRDIAIAESGGVIVHMNETQMETEVAVENPFLWKEQLLALQTHLVKQIADRQNVKIEPKDSMLSIRIAEKQEQGGKYLHTTFTDETVTEQWVATQTELFLEQSQERLLARFMELQKQYEFLTDETGEAIGAALHPSGNSPVTAPSGELFSQAHGIFQKIIEYAKEQQIGDLIDTTQALQTIAYMRTKLVAKFNPTAGYIDIGNSDLNKYSTLIRVLKERYGYAPDKVLVLHIGDSTTDILPTDQTGPGEMNEGADHVYSVSLSNSSDSLREATMNRGTYGVMTARPSTMGVADITQEIIDKIRQNA